MTILESGVSASLRTREDGPSRPGRAHSERSVPAQAGTEDKGRKAAISLASDNGRKTIIESAKLIFNENAVQSHGDKRDKDSCTDLTPILHTLIVDNYDSFTYSIFQYFATVNGVPPLVVKNDDFPSWDALKKSLPNVDNIVISPGPGRPEIVDDFGISSPALQEASHPTLGICLGHQGLAHVYGGKVINYSHAGKKICFARCGTKKKVSRAPEPVHGRKSGVEFLEGYDLFRGIEQGTTVLRYHSLVVEKATLPACLEVTCWTRDDESLIMGLRHRQLPLHSVQFHPESVGTADGFRMLENFREMSLAWWREERKRTAGNASLEDVEALSITLLRENRIAALAVAAGFEAVGGGDGAAEDDNETVAREETAALREKKSEAEGSAGENAATAEATKAATTKTEDAEEGNGDRAGWVINVAVVSHVRKKGNEGREQQQLQMSVEGSCRTSNSAYDQAVIFEKLFATENVCFWLDSSSADERCVGVHACKRYSRRRCFSYMGGCSGPFVEAIEYYVKEKKAIIRGFTRESETAAVTLQQADLFQLLATRLQRFSPAAGIDSSSPGSRSATNPGNNGTPNSSNGSTTNADSTHRACCGSCIKLRWWEMLDGALKEVAGDSSLCCHEPLQVSAAEALQDATVKESAAGKHAVAARSTGKQAGNLKELSASSSHAFPPFGFLGGYIGFFGYELRHLMEAYEGVSTPVLAPATAFNLDAAGRGNGQFKKTTGAGATAKASCLQGGNQACEERTSGADADGSSPTRGTSVVQQKGTPERAKTDESKQERAIAAAGRLAYGDLKVADQLEKAAENEGKFAVNQDGEEMHLQRKIREQQGNSTRTERQACDAVWLFADRVVAFDLENNIAYLLWLTLPTRAAPLSPAAPATNQEEEDVKYQQDCKNSCDQYDEGQQHINVASASAKILPSAAYTEKASAFLPSHSPFPTTTSSISHLAPPADLYSPPRVSVSASSKTGSHEVGSADETGAGKGRSRDLLLPVSATPSCSNAEKYTCNGIERVQLQWARQTLQQLLTLDSDVRPVPDAAAGATVKTEEREGRAERDEQTAVRSNVDKEKDAEKRDEGAAAAVVKRKATRKGESINIDIAEARTARAMASGNERSESGTGTREVAWGQADSHTERKAMKKMQQEKVKVKDDMSTAACSKLQEKGEKEKESETRESETEVSTTTLLSSLGLTAPLEQVSPYASTLKSASSSFVCSSAPSSFPCSALQQRERASWLLQPRDTKDRYMDKIKKVFDFIASGDAYEVCLTTEFSGSLALQTADLLAFYTFLRKRNPTPFGVFFRYQPQMKTLEKSSSPTNDENGSNSSTSSNTRVKACTASAPSAAGAASLSLAAASSAEAPTACSSFTICCASPELFLLLDKEGWLESRPIKGTRPRGRTAAADAVLAQELATSEKDAAENIMAVDVSRSDLGRVSVPGTVHVPELMVVESYSRVHQLVSTVRGKLRPELSFFDAVAAAFPAASMTGAPKRRVMKLLHELEQRERGLYSGAVGFLSVDRQAALNIAIRTLMFYDDEDCGIPTGSTRQERIVRASFGTGGAIVAASDPEEEVEEMQLKADSVLSLLHEFLSSSGASALSAGRSATLVDRTSG